MENKRKNNQKIEAQIEAVKEILLKFAQPKLQYDGMRAYEVACLILAALGKKIK